SRSMNANDLEQGRDIAARVEAFVRETVIPYEKDPRAESHGPTDELVAELRDKARAAGLLTPHIPNGTGHVSHRATSLILQAAGLSPLGPVALNVMAPDEGNIYML